MTTKIYPYPVNEFASPAEELIYWKLKEKLGEDYTVLYGSSMEKQDGWK